MRENDLIRSDIDILDAELPRHFIDTSAVYPYVAYSVLKQVIGEPSSEFNDDEVWAWEVKAFDVYLYVYGTIDMEWKVSAYHSDKKIAEKVGNEFIEYVKLQSTKVLAKLRSLSANATGHIFQNPYALYFSSAKNLLEQGEFLLDSERPWMVKKKQSDLIRSAFFLFVASFEGFLNLIYELYLKPSLRDERIYARLSREQVDIKLRLATMYCLCFSVDTIDHKNELFQKFQYIVDLRNDFIHANLTKPMRTTVVTEDKHEFLYEYEADGKYGLPKSIATLDVDNIKFVMETIEAMVDFVIESMKPRQKHEFRPIILEEQIFVTVVDNEYIIS